MSRIAVGLFAKYPVLNEVKTRLAETIGPARALDIYTKLLTRTVDTIVSLDQERYLTFAFITPSLRRDEFAAQYVGFDHYCEQKGLDLGERMRSAIDTMTQIVGKAGAIIVGADTPGIDTDTIDSAATSLQKEDLVIGPTADGGYFLIGMKELREPIFEGPAWGTATVRSITMQIASQHGLTVGLLRMKRDLDTYEDFMHFRSKGIV